MAVLGGGVKVLIPLNFTVGGRLSSQVVNQFCCVSSISASNSVVLSPSPLLGKTISNIRISRGRGFSSGKPRRGGGGISPVLATQETSTSASTSTLLVQEVEFVWKGQGSEVFLTGDFLKWETRLVVEKKSSDIFSLKQKLPVGKYSYKFIVDGEWKHSPDSPYAPDGSGGFNNELVVTDLSIKEASKVVTDETNTPQPSSSVEKVAATTEIPRVNDNAKSETTTTDPLKQVSKIALKESPQPSNTREKPVANKEPSKAEDKLAAPPKPVPKAKVVSKSLKETMLEDVIPLLTRSMSKEDGITNVDVVFEDNQLKTSFAKDDVPYCFWAFFPDGTLQGSRGSSLTSRGAAPSTIEPFLIDEKKITPELVVFWVKKRLFVQKILSRN